MQNISFDDCYKSYMINNDENKVIRINIGDLNIQKRYEDTKDKMLAEIDRIKNSKFTPDTLAQADETIRGYLNTIFGSDICTAVFGETNILSPVSSGKLLIESFLDAFLPMISEDIKSITLKKKYSPEDKTAKYIAPVLGKPLPFIAGMAAQPIDVNSMTDEQKNELLRQLLK